MLRTMKYCVIMLFCLPLAGCFGSKVPLINESNADKPFKRATIELTIEGDRSSFYLELRTSWYAVTKTAGDQRLDTLNNTRISLHKVQDNLFIIQMRDEEESKSVYFYIGRITGSELKIFKCGAYTDETRAKAGMALSECRTCPATLEQLVALAKMQPDGPAGEVISGKIQILE